MEIFRSALCARAVGRISGNDNKEIVFGFWVFCVSSCAELPGRLAGQRWGRGESVAQQLTAIIGERHREHSEISISSNIANRSLMPV